MLIETVADRGHFDDHGHVRSQVDVAPYALVDAEDSRTTVEPAGIIDQDPVCPRPGSRARRSGDLRRRLRGVGDALAPYVKAASAQQRC